MEVSLLPYDEKASVLSSAQHPDPPQVTFHPLKRPANRLDQ